jgi:hypothetical protein
VFVHCLSSVCIENPAVKFLHCTGIPFVARNHNQIRALLGRNISDSRRLLASKQGKDSRKGNPLEDFTDVRNPEDRLKPTADFLEVFKTAENVNSK